MKLPLAALVASLAALALAGAAWVEARRPAPAVTAGGGVTAAAPAKTGLQPLPDTSKPETGVPPPADDHLRAVTERLDKLEARLTVLERRRRDIAPAEPVDVKALETVILDRVKTPAERASALKIMRSRAPQARTIEVARSMIDLLRTCDDGTVRAEICRQLYGLDYAEIGEEMLTRLRTDEDDVAREEAAETLETFADAPGVIQALEYAKENDESPAVREQAIKSLAEIRAR
jgi:HEAT repeat protein